MKILLLKELAGGLVFGAILFQCARHGISLDAGIASFSYALGVLLMAGQLEAMSSQGRGVSPSMNQLDTQRTVLMLWTVSLFAGIVFPFLLGDFLGGCLYRICLGAASLFTLLALLPNKLR